MKKVLALTLALCMIFALCACGSTATTETAATETATAATETATTEAAAVETVEATSDEPIELTWWTYYGDSQQGYLQTSIDKFNEQQSKYHVTMVYQGSQAECIAKLEATDKANLPDIFNFGVEDVGTCDAADYCMNLQYFLDQDTEGWPELEGTWAGLRASYSNPDGDLIGYPCGYSYYCIWYNKDIFTEAGIDASALTSFDDLYEVSKTLVEGGYCTYGIGFHPVGYYVNGAITREGLKAYNNDNGWSGERITECLYTSDATVNAALTNMLTVYQKMSAENLMVPYGTNWQTEILPMMGNGDCAMLMVTISAYTRVKAAADGNWEIGIMPMLSCTEDGKLTSEPAGGTGIFAANTGNEEKMWGAYEFIKFMSEAEQSADFAIKTGYLAPNEQSYNDPSYQEFLKNDLPAAEAVYDSLENCNESGYYPYIPICNEMVVTNKTLVETACAGGNIADAIAAAEETIQEAIEMYNLSN